MMKPKSRHRESADLRIYNSLTKKKTRFVPFEPKRVHMYTCGLTVNYLMHIGHARTYIFWDIVERFLEYLGYEVKHVSNITDISVDDNILSRVRSSGEPFQQLTTRHTIDYYRDRQRLGIREPFTYAIATQHIQEMIELVQRLLERGFAYEAEDGIYFRIEAFQRYGHLSGLDPHTLRAGASERVDKDEYAKEYVSDFVLWKQVKPGEPFWHSPWGPGRPGWHLECSAMSMKYLGETIDISGGGEDNLFPHHENSIAQSEAATGNPYVRYWMHVRHLQLGRDKMSKSTGNFITVRDVVEEYDAASLRLFLLSTHYRKPITFTTNAIRRTSNQLNRLRHILNRLQVISENADEVVYDESEVLLLTQEARTQFESAMLDDFNSGRAINHFFQFVSKIQTLLETQKLQSPETAKSVLQFFHDTGSILFGDLYKHEILLTTDPMVRSLIVLLLNERAKLRTKRQYHQADTIRTALQSLGLEISDTKKGTVWWTKSKVEKNE